MPSNFIHKSHSSTSLHKLSKTSPMINFYKKQSNNGKLIIVGVIILLAIIVIPNFQTLISNFKIQDDTSIIDSNETNETGYIYTGGGGGVAPPVSPISYEIILSGEF